MAISSSFIRQTLQFYNESKLISQSKYTDESKMKMMHPVSLEYACIKSARIGSIPQHF